MAMLFSQDQGKISGGLPEYGAGGAPDGRVAGPAGFSVCRRTADRAPGGDPRVFFLLRAGGQRRSFSDFWRHAAFFWRGGREEAVSPRPPGR